MTEPSEFFDLFETLEPDVAPEPDPAEVEAAVAERPVTVLLVDDDPAIGEQLRESFAETDLVFHHQLDPMRAVDAALEVRPTVILLALAMPALSGMTLLRYYQVHPDLKDVPVVVFSAEGDPATKAEAFELGASDYIIKVPDRRELIARLRHHSKVYLTQLARSQAYDRVVRNEAQLELRNDLISETFGRYMSDEIAENILQNPEGQQIGGEKRRVTIMMTDLRGFTPVSERLQPEQVVSLINNYLGGMTEIIVGYGGTIDEFIGDAILVIFGAPVWRNDDAQRAVACAVAMQQEMKAVNAKNMSEGLPAVEMGIGLHTGEVVVGNIGSKRRAKYGVVGSNVNLTSRIESYTVGGQILASESTIRDAGEDVVVGDSMKVEPKGVKAPITIYDVAGIAGFYELYVDKKVEVFQSLEPAIALEYVVVEGKDTGGAGQPGQLIALSEHQGQIRSQQEVPPMSVLKLRLTGDVGPLADDVFYGKVATQSFPEGIGFILKLTSVPGPIQAFLDARRPK